VPKRPSHRGATISATLIALLLTALSSSFSRAQDDPYDPPASLDVVRVHYADRDQEIKLLISFKAQLLETVAHEGYHVMQLNPDEIDRLTGLGFRVQADPLWRPPLTQDRLTSTLQANGIPGYPCYRTVEETVTHGHQLALDHPRLVTWQDIGDSWQKTVGLGGYDIIALRLTNSQVPGPKPVLLLNAAIHAREYATAELVMRFVESLVADYGTDADATWILDYHEVHAVLYANPDGRKQAEAGLLWRKNTNQAYCAPDSDLRGADLNRNFDFQWACCNGSSASECAWDYHGPAAASEPEVQALQNYWSTVFVDQRGQDPNEPAPNDTSGILLDVHAYGELVLWPWGYTDQAAPNAAQLQTLGRKLAYWSRYTPQQAIGLYPTDGSSDDYAYGQFGVAAYTLELGTHFFQDCDTFEAAIVPDNLPALRYAAKVARAPYLMPAGPDSLQLSLSDRALATGAPLTLQAMVDDTRYYGASSSEPVQTVIAAEWYVDSPPWQAGSQAKAMAASDGEWDSSIEQVEATIDTSGWSPGWHTLFVRGQDADGRWGAVSALFVSVSSGTNHAPVAAFDLQCQGLACLFDAAPSFDRDGQIVAYAWSFGDGGSASGLAASHRYTTTGIYAVTLNVTDDNGATGSQTQNVVPGTRQSLYLPYIHTHSTDH
jgi:hypothetical protein